MVLRLAKQSPFGLGRATGWSCGATTSSGIPELLTFLLDCPSRLEGSEKDRDNYISQRRPVPIERLCGCFCSANEADKCFAQTTGIGGPLAGASYDTLRPPWHRISIRPPHRRLSARGDA